MVAEKIPGNRSIRRLLLQKLKLLWSLCLGLEIWIFAISGAINPLLSRTNTQKRRFLTKVSSNFRNVEPNLLNASRTLRPPTSLEKTIETIDAREEVIVTIALATQGFQASSKSLELMQPIFWHGIIVTECLNQITKTQTKVHITTIIKKNIFQTNDLSLTSQKTSIGLANFYVNDRH